VLRYGGRQGGDTADIDHVVFNSLVGTPSYGDERAFLDARKAQDTDEGSYVNEARVSVGDELILRVYVHNNANTNRNGQEQVARGTRVRFAIPSEMSRALRCTAYISAENAVPPIVSDAAGVLADRPVRLEYVRGSAMAYTNSASYALGDEVVEGGALIGEQSPDGVVRGNFDHDMTVQVRVRVRE
jgi:hypothetical protein